MANLATSRERVLEEAIVLVVAPDKLLVADSGRAACLLLEVRLPVSYDPFPGLLFVQSPDPTRLRQSRVVMETTAKCSAWRRLWLTFKKRSRMTINTADRAGGASSTLSTLEVLSSATCTSSIGHSIDLGKPFHFRSTNRTYFFGKGRASCSIPARLSHDTCQGTERTQVSRYCIDQE